REDGGYNADQGQGRASACFHSRHGGGTLRRSKRRWRRGFNCQGQLNAAAQSGTRVGRRNVKTAGPSRCPAQSDRADLRHRKLARVLTPRWAPRLIILQPTPYCNISCSYCYLGSRDDRRLMPRKVVDAVRDKIFSRLAPDAAPTIVWHAGEPTTAPISW